MKVFYLKSANNASLEGHFYVLSGLNYMARILRLLSPCPLFMETFDQRRAPSSIFGDNGVWDRHHSLPTLPCSFQRHFIVTAQKLQIAVTPSIAVDKDTVEFTWLIVNRTTARCERGRGSEHLTYSLLTDVPVGQFKRTATYHTWARRSSVQAIEQSVVHKVVLQLLVYKMLAVL